MRTERLTLRPWVEHDLDALHQMWINAEMRRYLWDDVVITRETTADVLRSHFEGLASRGVGYWAVEPSDSRVMIGFCGFRTIAESTELELLYGLLPGYWRQGLAAEAACAALNYLWANSTYVRVFARTDPPNTKSVAVMKRLGMRPYSSTEKMITYVLDRPAPCH